MLRERLGLSADRPVLLFVGRFVEKKGLRLLHELATGLPQCEWVFIGWGPEDPASWGLSHVRCPGSLPQRAIADYYRAADLLVLPSVGEGFPLVVQEAMACGLPAAISTETAAGAPEAARLLWCLDLHPKVWHQALANFEAAGDQLDQWRQMVADYAQRHWDWDVCVDGYLALFQSLVSSAA
jgi:glycosyltransferase involved in cell wall biosynthesis